MFPSDEAASRDDAWRHIYFTIVVYTRYVHADSRPALFVDPVFKIDGGHHGQESEEGKEGCKEEDRQEEEVTSAEPLWLPDIVAIA